MQPRFYTHSVQYVTYHSQSSRVKFETRYVSGRHFNFILSKDQFFSMNDAIYLIERDQGYGHFPLGQGVWLHYNCFDASLYKQTDMGNDKRLYFKFACFDEYRKFTHQRLLTLIRLNDNEAAAAAAASYRQRRKRRGGEEGEVNSTSHKRPLSIVLRSPNRSSASRRSGRGEREATSRTSDNANMSHNGEDGAIFSEWHCSNSRRRSDSIATLSPSSKDLLSPEDVQLNSGNSTISMESE